jgi:lysozyme
MITSLEEQLKRDEGEVLHAYQDSLGFWTIGVGRLIDAKRGGGITKAESSILLANDITKAEIAIAAAAPWASALDPVRKGVLLNMHFQLGDGLFNFHNTLDLIRTGKWDEASAAMWKSKWATQTPERVMRLQKQLQTGIYQ